MFDHDRLDHLFRPRSVAVIGASTNADKIGGIPIAHLQRFGYQGAVYPVNPRATTVQGLRCYANVRDIGMPIDLAILALPLAAAEQALCDAADAGVTSAVLFTSGYAEVGDKGRAEQSRLTVIAQERGIRVLGPNCLGFMNLRDNVYATFSPAPASARMLPGKIGLVSQSGAFGMYAYGMARERGIGLSYWVSTGNECDLEFADIVAWLVRDPGTEIIMGYMEGCRDGAKLKAALQLAQDAGKPVIITKVGRTISGAAAAASHTAALAGDDAVFDALLRQYGAIRARTVDAFFNAGYVLSRGVRPRSVTAGILTLSGGVGALMADDAHDAGLELPSMPEAAQRKILERVPFAATRNPVDITGQVTSEIDLLVFSARIMLDTDCYGSLLCFFAAAGLSETIFPHVLAFVRTIRSEYPAVPLIMCSLFSAERRQAIEEVGGLVFADPTVAVLATRMLARTASATRRRDTLAPSTGKVTLAAGAANEPTSLAVLQRAGVPVVPVECVQSAQAAVKAAQRIGFPVVLKIVSSDISHKSDIGGVRLHLQDEAAVRAAHDSILENVKRALPGARIDGVLVAPMISSGVECIVGVQRDPVYGPVVMVGLGGVLVELLRDISFRLAPFDHTQAHAMIDELKGRALLNGHRGSAPVDVAALADALVAMSNLAVAAGDSLESIDINPFLVRERGALAVDAVVIGR